MLTAASCSVCVVCVLHCSHSRLDAYAPQSTLLHSAAQHSRADCVPLLLAAGVDPTAVSNNGCTALRLACNDCDLNTVQLIVQAGGWHAQFAAECLARAIVKHKPEVLELLYEAEAAVIGDASTHDYCLPKGLSLMHVAAAARSLSCAEALVRHGAAADAVITSDNSTASADITGLSPLDLLVLKGPTWSLLRTEPAPAQLTAAEFGRFALLLLSCGATIKHSAMSAQEYSCFAGAIQQHAARLQRQLRKKTAVAAVHSAACYDQYAGGSSDAPPKIVKVQLVHTDTQQLGARVYTIDTELLAQLLSVDAAAATATVTVTTASDNATTVSTDTAPSATFATAAECTNSSAYSTAAVKHPVAQQCALMRMLLPAEGWQTVATDAVTYISCDGESFMFVHTICICVRTYHSLHL
jgi:Ankyrin repeats (many copies)